MIFMTPVGPMRRASVSGGPRHQFHRVDRDMRPSDEPDGPDQEEIQQHTLRLLQHEL
jgi:hypothetical protein